MPTRVNPTAESEGRFESDWVRAEWPCRHCGSEDGHFRESWESGCGGYEDEKHECVVCDKEWWVEGPDA